MNSVLLRVWVAVVCVYFTCSNAEEHTQLDVGAQLYVQCTGCHAPNYNRTGPMHCGISDRKAGGVENFDYSQAMLESNIIWNPQTLNEFLRSPLTAMPGTSMGFVGIESESDRQQLIEYLISLDSQHPACQ